MLPIRYLLLEEINLWKRSDVVGGAAPPFFYPYAPAPNQTLYSWGAFNEAIDGHLVKFWGMYLFGTVSVHRSRNVED